MLSHFTAMVSPSAFGPRIEHRRATPPGAIWPSRYCAIWRPQDSQICVTQVSSLSFSPWLAVRALAVADFEGSNNPKVDLAFLGIVGSRMIEQAMIMLRTIMNGDYRARFHCAATYHLNCVALFTSILNQSQLSILLVSAYQ